MSPLSSEEAQAIAEPNTILRVEVGSTTHGIDVGADDRDEMGICIEPPEYVVGLKPFDQWVFRTQPEGVRSGPGDLDLTIYSARKWCRLALKGNPTVLLPLFVPSKAIIVETVEGYLLRDIAPAFASLKAGEAFLKYMLHQRERITGERGQMNVKRPELIEAYGYDTKYMGHILRLGYQGIEYMTTGRLTLPMPEAEREYIVSVRRGGVSQADALVRADELQRDLEEAIADSPLPEEPEHDRVDRWLFDRYTLWWELGRIKEMSGM